MFAVSEVTKSFRCSPTIPSPGIVIHAVADHYPSISPNSIIRNPECLVIPAYNPQNPGCEDWAGGGISNDGEEAIQGYTQSIHGFYIYMHAYITPATAAGSYRVR